MGFCAVAYRFQSSSWCPKDHYLGHCTVCLGTSAHRPCFDLSVCLQPVCLQPVCLQPVCLQPVCLQPVCLQPVCLQPVCLQPVCLQPVCLQPVCLQPVCLQPVCLQPVCLQPVCLQPVCLQPVCLQPVCLQPVCLQPVCLQPVCLQPVCLQPVCLQPVCLQPVCLQPVCLQPVCLQPVCLQPVCLSPDSQSDCLRFFPPPHPPSFVDSLDSELWYRSGCRAAALASSSTEAVGQSFRQLSPHGARSKGDQQPDGRVAHNSEASNILGVDIRILATRVLRARKTRKSLSER